MLKTETASWYSENCGMNMTVKRYGDWGPPLIYFPTCGGKHGEFDWYNLAEDMYPWIAAGKVQVFSIDSINQETFYNQTLHPYHKIQWQKGYERYVMDELLPFILHKAQNDNIACMGSSFGGYTVARFFFKYPQVFRLAVAMSSTFSMKNLLEGYYDNDVYYNSPTDFLPNQSDPHFYHTVNQESLFWMFCGENDICIQENDEFSSLLNSKGIRHWYDRWPSPCDHHEFWWKKQVPVVLQTLYS
jgi:esterase/lipase superfamily enzyme